MTNKLGTMRKIINEIYTILRRDETLMRLLAYAPKSYSDNTPDPLDPSLPDIVDEMSEKYWETVDESILTVTKSANIELDAMCRLYLYSGRRKSNAESYVLANQEVVIDILVHDKFSKDIRMEWIGDRINELLVLENILGSYGKLEYAGGAPRHAPISYSSYEHNFVFIMNKK